MRARPDEVRHVVYEQERLGPRVGYFLQLLAGVGWTSLPALPLIRQPTLVLAGNDDPIIPLVNARIMRTLLPHATLHVFDDGHLGLLTSADELGPLVSAVPDLAATRRLHITRLTTHSARAVPVVAILGQVWSPAGWPGPRRLRARTRPPAEAARPRRRSADPAAPGPRPSLARRVTR